MATTSLGPTAHRIAVRGRVGEDRMPTVLRLLHGSRYKTRAEGLLRPAASVLAMRSEVLPGSKGTMSVMGLSDTPRSEIPAKSTV